jgi:hypothetical protein
VARRRRQAWALPRLVLLLVLLLVLVLLAKS